MSHKRRGQITVSGEWAKHLRPFLRRAFWKKERQATHDLVRKESSSMQPDGPAVGTLESLLAAIEALATNAESAALWVPEHLTYEGNEIQSELAMAVVTDKLLARGLYPNGVARSLGGARYRYCKG
jgi:hypothetical protein